MLFQLNPSSSMIINRARLTSAAGETRDRVNDTNARRSSLVRLKTDCMLHIVLLKSMLHNTRSLEAADNASEPEVLLSVTGLEQHSLTLVSSSPLVVDGQTLGEVFVYDDPTTKRPADYFELYDNPGDLIAVGLV